jgi:hypothetical protein
MRNEPPACRCVQGEGGLALDPHLHCPGEDAPDLLSRMGVPARLHAGRDLSEHLHDLASGNRGWAVLELGAHKRSGGASMGSYGFIMGGRHGRTSRSIGKHQARRLTCWLHSFIAEATS